MFKIKALIWDSFWRLLKFQPFNWRVGSNPRCRSKNIEMKYIPVLNLCMNYVVHVSSTMWRIKNGPSNSTSCSDNALRLLVLVACIVYCGLQVSSSFSIWGCVVKGCFEGGIFRRAKLRLKGIEDFNLEHSYTWLCSWCILINKNHSSRWLNIGIKKVRKVSLNWISKIQDTSFFKPIPRPRV